MLFINHLVFEKKYFGACSSPPFFHADGLPKLPLIQNWDKFSKRRKRESQSTVSPNFFFSGEKFRADKFSGQKQERMNILVLLLIGSGGANIQLLNEDCQPCASFHTCQDVAAQVYRNFALHKEDEHLMQRKSRSMLHMTRMM